MIVRIFDGHYYKLVKDLLTSRYVSNRETEDVGKAFVLQADDHVAGFFFLMISLWHRR